jgi:hypothetical protein
MNTYTKHIYIILLLVIGSSCSENDAIEEVETEINMIEFLKNGRKREFQTG